MSIDSSGRSVGYNILNGTGSEPQKSQHEVYVRFDRADAIEPLLAYVKCTYYINNPIGRSGRPGRHFGVFSKRFEEGACIWLRGEPSVFKPPGCFEPPGRFILSFFVSISSRNFSHGLFQTDAGAVYRVTRQPLSGFCERVDPGEVKSV